MAFEENTFKETILSLRKMTQYGLKLMFSGYNDSRMRFNFDVTSDAIGNHAIFIRNRKQLR